MTDGTSDLLIPRQVLCPLLTELLFVRNPLGNHFSVYLYDYVLEVSQLVLPERNLFFPFYFEC